MDSPLQLVNVRLAISGEATPFRLPQIAVTKSNEQGFVDTASLYGVEQPVQIYQREVMGAEQVIKGPVLVVEKVATSYIAQGWQARVDAVGNLLLSKA